MFQAGECNPLLYMDFKNYGVCGSNSGTVNWKITNSHLLKNKNYLCYTVGSNDKLSDHNNNNNSLCFKYYDGLTGALRAKSSPLFVYSDAQILVSSITCKDLSKSRNIYYYAKIDCGGTKMCNYRTAYSADAYWTGLNFLFPADRSCELRFTIKEKRWSRDQTLGLLNIPIIDLLQRKNQNLAFVLRTPSLNGDSNISKHCQIVVSCQLIPQQRQTYADTINSLISLPSNRHALAADDERHMREQQNAIHKSPLNTDNSLTSSSTYTQSISSFSFEGMASNESKVLRSAQVCNKVKENTLIIQPSASASSSSTSNSTTSSHSSTSIANLPKGWEVRMDRYGRLIYLDHVNKRTTWHPPSILDNELIQSDLRYICTRRTVFNQNNNNNYNDNNNNDNNNNDMTGVHDYAKISRSDIERDKSSMKRRTRNATCKNAIKIVHFTEDKPKAVKFLQRNDFLSVLQTNTEALNLYNKSAYLKHIIHRIRREPSKFASFERNRELVEFLNLFSDKTQPLPNGWQTAKHCNNSAQRLFIDHTSKRITLIDPRLPDQLVPRRRTRSAPPSRNAANGGASDSNACGIWDLLNRTDEIQTLVSERFPEMAPKLCRKLQLINRLGEIALLRFANDVDLITAISVLEQSTNRPKSEFEERLEFFYSSLQRAGYGQGPGKMHFRLRRSQLMNDAYDKILSVEPSRLKKCQMAVTFDEEDGLDYGGPSRELFFLLSRDLFSPYYGLFEYSANDTYTVQISPISKFVDNYLQWMELCGRILGLALIHRCMIDTFFTRAFYKFLLRTPYTIADLQSMDSQFHNSLLWIRRNEVTDDLDLTFSTTEEVGGQIIEKELLPGGKNILVTELNKEEYISRVLRWRMERSVEQQGQALLRGLYSVIDRDYLRVFNGEQLELVLSGTIEINIEDWRQNTEYKGGYHDGHIVVDWFWQTVYTFCNADRLKLIQFVTGTSSVPYEGFKALRGSNGPKKFTIEKWGTEDSLPRAHTCFNRMDLPSYPTQKILCEKLKYAICESSCYSIE